MNTMANATFFLSFTPSPISLTVTKKRKSLGKPLYKLRIFITTTQNDSLTDTVKLEARGDTASQQQAKLTAFSFFYEKRNYFIILAKNKDDYVRYQRLYLKSPQKISAIYFEQQLQNSRFNKYYFYEWTDGQTFQIKE